MTPQINKVLSSLLTALKPILGDELLGIYLYGSAVWGDFDEDISDIDLLVVVKSDIDQIAFNKLNVMHHELVKQYPNWDDRIEIAYLSERALKTFKSQRSPIAVISPGEPFNIKDAGTDWLINWYLIQEKNEIVFGPDPKAFINPISTNEYIDAVKQQASEWQDWVKHTENSRPFQAYAVLTLCRALYAVENGRHASKQEAATWVQTKYPAWAAIVLKAIEWRKDYKNQQVDPSLTFKEVEKTVCEMILKINQ